VRLSDRSNRVHIHNSEELPMNATASGFAYLAFAPDIPIRMRQENLPSFTELTITDPERLQQSINLVKKTGYSVVRGSFEDDVTGIAVPIFTSDGFAIGALAVASPSSRINEKHTAKICDALFAETIEVSKALGGKIPPHYQQLTQAA